MLTAISSFLDDPNDAGRFAMTHPSFQTAINSNQKLWRQFVVAQWGDSGTANANEDWRALFISRLLDVSYSVCVEQWAL